MNSNRTVLDKLIDRAVITRRKLRKLEEGRKLTFEAFLEEALEIADCDEATIKKLGSDLDSRTGTQRANAFVRKMVAVLREPRYPRCPRDPARCLKIYGEDGAFIELQGLNATVAQAVALAVMLVKERFGDDAFGVIESWPQYEQETSRLRDQTADLAGKMKNAVSGQDLEFSTDDLNSEERKKGLVRCTFRRAPGLVLSDQGWPDRLISDCEAPVPVPKKKRERLAA